MFAQMAAAELWSKADSIITPGFNQHLEDIMDVASYDSIWDNRGGINYLPLDK
jgi:hypothetical protein